MTFWPPTISSISVFWPSSWPTSRSPLDAYGQLGEYIGGVWGSAISVLTLVVVYLAWRSTRRAEVRASLMAILAEMLKTHDSIVRSAPEMTTKALREFSAIYKISRRVSPTEDIWSIRQRTDMCYIFVFFGLSSHATNLLNPYGKQEVKRIHDEAGRLRDNPKLRLYGLFKGNQKELSHYFRNLFGMYVLIDKAKLKRREKIDIAKVVRTKLSNYDQALLILNVISRLGREWENQGLIENYKPFANVPENFFGHDPKFLLKAFFPSIQFEWEKWPSIEIF